MPHLGWRQADIALGQLHLTCPVQVAVTHGCMWLHVPWYYSLQSCSRKVSFGSSFPSATMGSEGPSSTAYLHPQGRQEGVRQ
jgi:hypothetical protein